MSHRLIRVGQSREQPEPRMFARHDSLKSGYGVVIIRGGGLRSFQCKPNS